MLIICSPMLSMILFRWSRATSAWRIARMEMKFSAQNLDGSWPS